jgi:hypothetical protein
VLIEAVHGRGHGRLPADLVVDGAHSGQDAGGARLIPRAAW